MGCAKPYLFCGMNLVFGSLQSPALGMELHLNPGARHGGGGGLRGPFWSPRPWLGWGGGGGVKWALSPSRARSYQFSR